MASLTGREDEDTGCFLDDTEAVGFLNDFLEERFDVSSVSLTFFLSTTFLTVVKSGDDGLSLFLLPTVLLVQIT